MEALLGADLVTLNRYEPGAEIFVLAHRGLDVARTPVGRRVSHEGAERVGIGAAHRAAGPRWSIPRKRPAPLRSRRGTWVST